MKGRPRETFRYSDSFKEMVVREVETSSETVYSIRKKYDIKGGSTISNWVKKYGKSSILPTQVRVEMSNEYDRREKLINEQADRIRKLEKALSSAHLTSICDKAYVEAIQEILGADKVAELEKKKPKFKAISILINKQHLCYTKEEIYSEFAVSRQSFSQWNKRISIRPKVELDLILKYVKETRELLPYTGTKKLWKGLINKHGKDLIGRDAFYELLHSKDLFVYRKKRRGYRGNKLKNNERYPMYLMNSLKADEAGKVIASDITYLPKGDNKFNYLHLCIDLYSRMIVGWCLSESLETKHSIKALEMGIKTLKKNNKYRECWVHHSDRGTQYISSEYREIIYKNKGLCSMTIGGAPYQNAIVERTNGVLKQELIVNKQDKEFKKSKKHVKECISIYNNERLHWAIDLQTPMYKLTS